MSVDCENRSSATAWLVLILALVGAASMLEYEFGLFLPRVRQANTAKGLGGGYAFGNDFYPLWLTSRELQREHIGPYSRDMTRMIQRGLFGRPLDTHHSVDLATSNRLPADRSTDPPEDYRTFAYPIFADLLFWPASEIPFPTARIVLAILLTAATIASVLLWMRSMGWPVNWVSLTLILLLTLSSYPVLEGLYACQLGLAVGFFLSGSLLALQRGRFFLSGVLIALTAVKPQMTLLVILYLLFWSAHEWQLRKHFCVGLLSAMLVLCGLGWLVWPHWIESWLRVIAGYHRYADPPLTIEVIATPLGSSRFLAYALFSLAVLLAAAIAWRNRRAEMASDAFWHTLSLLLAITVITLLPGQAVHDHVILLPGIFFLARGWRSFFSRPADKILLAVGFALLLWGWIASAALLVLRTLLTTTQFYSKAIFALPLRTAAVFPFAVLALLALAYRAQRTSYAQSF